MTAATGRLYPFQVMFPAKSCGLAKTSKAQAEQIRSIAAQRVGGTAGLLPGELLDELDDAIRLHLGLS